MITSVGLLDGLTPAVAAWQKDLNPAAGRALLKAGRVIRRVAVQNVNAMFGQTGRFRTHFREFSTKDAGRMRVKIPTRGIRIKLDQAAGLRTVRIWHGSGILAAHELGASIPPTTIRPVTRRVLGWGGTPAKRESFAAVVNRRGFTLRKRRTLEPAYYATASAVLDVIEAEYQKLLDQAPPALKT